MSLSRDQINSWLHSVNITGKHVFDIGSGPKEKWTKNQVKGEPVSYTTFDIDPAFAHHKLDLNLPLKDQGIPENLLKQNQITFCIECLEHTWNPVQAIANLSEMTNEVCYITVPFINPIHCTVDYLRYTNEWFEEVMPKFGFTKVEVQQRTATKGLEHLKNFYSSEGLRISKIRLQKGEGHKINYIGQMIKACK